MPLQGLFQGGQQCPLPPPSPGKQAVLTFGPPQDEPEPFMLSLLQDGRLLLDDVVTGQERGQENEVGGGCQYHGAEQGLGPSHFPGTEAGEGSCPPLPPSLPSLAGGLGAPPSHLHEYAERLLIPRGASLSMEPELEPEPEPGERSQKAIHHPQGHTD